MKNWRPDGWDKTRLDYLAGEAIKAPIGPYSVHPRLKSFEAGADAMYEEILKLIEKLGYQRAADDIRLYTGEVRE